MGLKIPFAVHRFHSAWLAVALQILLAIGMAQFAASLAQAQSVQEFYKGKIVRIVVGVGAGDVYDVYARLVGQFISGYIPGNPTIVVQNKLGAGGFVAANDVYNLLPQDGTIIGAPQRSLIAEDILGIVSNINFDSSKFNWIGSVTEEVSTLPVMTRSGVSSFQDLKGKEILVGSTGAGEFYPALLTQALGAKIRLVRGYTTPGAMLMAMERGELDSGLQSLSGFINRRMDWVQDGTVKFIYISGYEKDPQFPDVALLADLVTKENLLPGYDFDDLHSLLKIRMSDTPLGRAYMAGPGVPTDRVSTLRDAFDAAVKDEALLANAAKSKLKVSPKGGVALQAMVQELKAIPQDKIKRLADLITYSR